MQRERFGGFNIGAAFFGWLVSNSISVLLIGLLSAAGSAVALSVVKDVDELTQSSDAQSIGVVGGILFIVVMVIAYYAGGYVAGRMSRFDGGRQGIGVWIFNILAVIGLAVAGALLGAKYNLLQQLNLPTIPVDGSQLTTAGLLTLLLTLVITFFAALAGGKAGEHYHRKVDEVAGTAD
jgi:hypothetical protein